MSEHKVALYFAPGSSSIFPHFLLHHCNIPFEKQGVRFSDPSKLASVNDKQQVPVLVLDGTTITENPAIARCISYLAPDQHLFGHTDLESVKVTEWLNWLSATLHAQAWSLYMRPQRFTTDAAPEGQAAVKNAAERSVRERFARLERQLDDSGPWALGTNFTAVDPYLIPYFRCGRDILQADMHTDYPKWAAIVDRLLSTEAGIKALDDERVAKEA